MSTPKQLRRQSETSAELTVAAGLLEANGGLDRDLSIEEATERLQALLTPVALWWSGPLTPSQLSQSTIDRMLELPRWRRPDPSLVDHLESTVLAAWNAAIPTPAQGWGAHVLRIEVEDASAAMELLALGTAGAYLIVPSVVDNQHSGFSWRWPMRIGIAEGPNDKQWLGELEQSPFKELYDARIVTPHDTAPLDIVFVDANTESITNTATCVVVLGQSVSAEDCLVRGRAETPEATFVIGAPSADISWFTDAVREMAHDQPIDVALRIASPDSLIAGVAGLLQFTAVRQWTLGLAEQLSTYTFIGRNKAGQRLFDVGTTEVFDAERKGASTVAREVQILEKEGHETTLRDPTELWRAQFGMAMRDDSLTDRPAPALGDARNALPHRRLIADAQANGGFRRETLLPHTDHELLVRIAVPGAGETAAQQDFPEDELPANTTVVLHVDVTCPELNLRAREYILLSTASRTASSTIATFPFHTLEENSAVTIKILVTYKERPLQEAHYTASVRSRARTGDHAQLIAVALSSSPEPRSDATPADLSLEVNGASLERTGSDAAVDLSQLNQVLDDIELLASQVLGNDDAPNTLADPASVQLMITLAQYGSMLKTYLDPLSINDASTISLLVNAGTRVLPLELAYEAPSPDDAAKLCEHRPGGSMAGRPEACENLTRDEVCPYAFWGQQRIIARTIRVHEAAPRSYTPPPPPAPLTLRPALYAAVARADANSPVDSKPSDILEAELAQVLGAATLGRVYDWAEWQRQVRATHPQLLVILGHTENASVLGTKIEIGQGSWLKTSAIRAELLRDADAPQPLVVLLACASAVARDPFGGLPAAFTGHGAAAVVATLSKLRGPHGARTAARVVRALCAAPHGPMRLGVAMKEARRQLIDEGLLIGLLLVAHGEIDVPISN